MQFAVEGGHRPLRSVPDRSQYLVERRFQGHCSSLCVNYEDSPGVDEETEGQSADLRPILPLIMRW